MRDEVVGAVTHLVDRRLSVKAFCVWLEAARPRLATLSPDDDARALLAETESAIEMFGRREPRDGEALRQYLVGRLHERGLIRLVRPRSVRG